MTNSFSELGKYKGSAEFWTWHNRRSRRKEELVFHLLERVNNVVAPPLRSTGQQQRRKILSLLSSIHHAKSLRIEDLCVCRCIYLENGGERYRPMMRFEYITKLRADMPIQISSCWMLPVKVFLSFFLGVRDGCTRRDATLALFPLRWRQVKFPYSSFKKFFSFFSFYYIYIQYSRGRK